MARVQRLDNSVEVEVDFFFYNLRTFKTKVLSSLMVVILLDFQRQCAPHHHPIFIPNHPILFFLWLSSHYVYFVYFFNCYLLLLSEV